MHPVIIDCDMATDDVIAILYLLMVKDINIKAITVSGTGEAYGVSGATNLSNLLYTLNCITIPIAYGAADSLDGFGHCFPEDLRQLMNNMFVGMAIDVNPNPIISDSATDLIKETLENSSEKVDILVTGPLTNIAQVLTKFSHLKNKIGKIVIMGGAVNVEGNINILEALAKNNLAEWNFFADPMAAKIVISSGLQITLVPLDATNQVPLNKDFYDYLKVQTFQSLKLMYQLLEVIVDTYGEQELYGHFYLWNTLAAMILVNPQLGITEKTAVTVNLYSGQTKPEWVDAENSGLIDVVMRIPFADKFLADLIVQLTNIISEKSFLKNKESTATTNDFVKSNFGLFPFSTPKLSLGNAIPIYK